MSTKKILTLGEAAARLRKPLWRLQWVIASRGIAPDCRIGRLRGYSEATVDGPIADALADIASHRRKTAVSA